MDNVVLVVTLLFRPL